MKLLMTTDTIGGVWTYALDLAKAVAPLGVEIALATMGDPLSPPQRREVAAHANIVVHQSTYRLEWMDDPWDDVAAAGRWLLELEQKLAPDLVHLNGYAHASLPFAAPIVVVAHSCVLSWWRAVKGEAAPASWNRYRDVVAQGLHDADVVVAPTCAMLDALEENYGPLRHKRVIYNGRDPSLYHRGRKEPFILSAGRLWDEAKNVATLATAAASLTWPICVAGDSFSPDGHAGSSHAIINVRSLGKLDPQTLANFFARAEIYALPARYEPFGLSALEAGLSGCALVLGDIPTLREVWSDAAVFVAPDDVHGLTRQLRALIDDPHERFRLGRRAQFRAAEYTLTRVGDAYRSLYGQALRRRGAVDTAVESTNPFPPAQQVRI